MTERTELPLRAKRAREARRWTQKEVARMAGMSVRAYQMFELGQSWPQASNLSAVLSALELDSLPAEDEPEFAPDIEVFLGVFGAYLETLGAAERAQFMQAEARRIFSSKRSADIRAAVDRGIQQEAEDHESATTLPAAGASA